MHLYARLIGWNFDKYDAPFITGAGCSSDCPLHSLRLDDLDYGKERLWMNAVNMADPRRADIHKFVDGADLAGEVVDFELHWAYQSGKGILDWEGCTWTFAMEFRIPTTHPANWKLPHWCIMLGGEWVPLVMVLQAMEIWREDNDEASP